MAEATGNQTSLSAAGTSDFVRIKKGQVVFVDCTSWNSATAALYVSRNTTTTGASALEDINGAVSFTANGATVVDANAWVYMVVTGSPSAAIYLTAG